MKLGKVIFIWVAIDKMVVQGQKSKVIVIARSIFNALLRRCGVEANFVCTWYSHHSLSTTPSPFRVKLTTHLFHGLSLIFCLVPCCDWTKLVSFIAYFRIYLFLFFRCYHYLVNKSRAGASPSEPPQISGEAPPRTFFLTSTRLYPFPHSFSSTTFNSKSIELLTGSGEVLVYCIQQWRHHFESGRAGDKKYQLTKKFDLHFVNVHLCGPLHLHGPLYLDWALSLLCGPFTPV